MVPRLTQSKMLLLEAMFEKFLLKPFLWFPSYRKVGQFDLRIDQDNTAKKSSCTMERERCEAAGFFHQLGKESPHCADFQAGVLSRASPAGRRWHCAWGY